MSEGGDFLIREASFASGGSGGGNSGTNASEETKATAALFTREDVWLLRNYAEFESCKCKYHGGGLASIADRIEAHLPRETP